MFQHFPIDDLLSEMHAFDANGADMDLWISALSFKTLDTMPRPQPFVIDVVTYRADVWRRLLADCNRRIWLSRELRGVAVYMPNRDYACVRLYNYFGMQGGQFRRPSENGWEVLPSLDELRRQLDTPALRTRYAQWTAAQEAALSGATAFVEGRQANTLVEQSVVISSTGGGCVACGAPATRHASSTIGTDKTAKMLHFPLCEEHFAEAQDHPSVLDFASKLFELDVDLPEMQKLDHVPDDMVEPMRTSLATLFQAGALPAEKRRNGWDLKFTLPSGWYYRLRMRALNDYSYMLFDASGAQRYRADSARDHPELPYFPDHEHHEPNAANILGPSFLYGNPFWDAKRLFDVARSMGAYNGRD